MKTRKDDPNDHAANPYIACARLTTAIVALENAKPLLKAILAAEYAHPLFHNLQIELLNLDYVLRTLPIQRDKAGRPLHPSDIKRCVK